MLSTFVEIMPQLVCQRAHREAPGRHNDHLRAISHSLNASSGFRDRSRSSDSGIFAGCIGATGVGAWSIGVAAGTMGVGAEGAGVAAGAMAVGAGGVGVAAGAMEVGGVTSVGGTTTRHTPIAPSATRPMRDAATSTGRDRDHDGCDSDRPTGRRPSVPMWRFGSASSRRGSTSALGRSPVLAFCCSTSASRFRRSSSARSRASAVACSRTSSSRRLASASWRFRLASALCCRTAASSRTFRSSSDIHGRRNASQICVQNRRPPL